METALFVGLNLLIVLCSIGMGFSLGNIHGLHRIRKVILFSGKILDSAVKDREELEKTDKEAVEVRSALIEGIEKKHAQVEALQSALRILMP